MTATQWRPVRAVGVYTRRAGESVLIEGYLDVYETNHVGGFIWSQCGNGLTLDEIGQAVVEHYGIDAETAASTVREFVTSLRDLGFVS